MDYILRTRNISKKYGNVYAIKDINIEIRQGQIYGLIGLNGAGKSTFMRSVVGLISLTEGEIELFGQTGKKASVQNRKYIGQSIENPAVYPDMTACQNLELQRILGNVRDKGCVKKTLATVGLADTGSKKAKNFSLGMKQRLALGIALITSPRFLILDEPVNGLDPIGIIEIRGLMQRLAAEEGITILVSSHILDELAQIATHYGIIHKGKLIKQFPADELAKESRKYIRITSNDTAGTLEVLRTKMGVSDFNVDSKKQIRVYEKLDLAGKMNTLLVQSGIEVESIGIAEQRLEDYFVNLTEGNI